MIRTAVGDCGKRAVDRCLEWLQEPDLKTISRLGVSPGSMVAKRWLTPRRLVTVANAKTAD